MAITEEEIKVLARLARLDFDESRCGSFVGEFEEMIQFANTVNCEIEGDTATIREVGGREIALEELRCDEVEESLPVDKILSNVKAEGGYFSVRRVVK